MVGNLEGGLLLAVDFSPAAMGSWRHYCWTARASCCCCCCYRFPTVVVAENCSAVHSATAADQLLDPSELYRRMKSNPAEKKNSAVRYCWTTGKWQTLKSRYFEWVSEWAVGPGLTLAVR